MKVCHIDGTQTDGLVNNTHNSTSEKACLFPTRNNRVSADEPASLLEFIHACQYSANVFVVIAPIAYESSIAAVCQLHLHINVCSFHSGGPKSTPFKEGMYRIWCGVNTLGDSGVNTLGDTSAFVNPTVQLLLTRRGKIRMDGVGIVFEFYIAHL